MEPKRLILLALLSAGAAFANTMLVTGVNTNLGLQNSLWINDNGTNVLLYFAGAVDIVVDGYKREVFCVDFLTSIQVPGTYSTTMDFSDTIHDGDYSQVPYVQRAGWLLQNRIPTTPVEGAALQLAIWDIVTDQADGFGTRTQRAGKVTQSTVGANVFASAPATNAAVLAAAIQYELDSLDNSSTAGIVYHNTSGSVPVQTLMGNNATDNGPSPIPEPGAIFLSLSGLALIGLSRLRRFRPR